MSNKCPRIVGVTYAYLWHCRLGHNNKNRMNKLAQEGILDDNDNESLSTYESYLLGKMTKSPFTRKNELANDVLGLVYSDVCGPMNIDVREGYYYFITFIDDLSRYGYIYLIKHKLNHLKCSSDSVMRKKNKLRRALKLFDLIEEVNIFLMSF